MATSWFPSWQAYSYISYPGARVSGIEMVQGRSYTSGSSIVASHMISSREMRVKRSTTRMASPTGSPFRRPPLELVTIIARSLKFLVSTTSVSPSQCARASPVQSSTPPSMCARSVTGMMRAS